jgi:hypothetical protein
VLKAATSLLKSGYGPDSETLLLLSSCIGLEYRGSGSVLRSPIGVLSRGGRVAAGGAPFFRLPCEFVRNSDLVLLKKRCGVVLPGSGGLEGGVVAEPLLGPGDATTVLARRISGMFGNSILRTYSARLCERLYIARPGFVV